MDPQKQAEETTANSFTESISERPDLVVGPQEQAFAVATIPSQQAAPPVSAPHPDSISHIVKGGTKLPPKKGDSAKGPTKLPMTPRRFMNFVGGLFLAGMAGAAINPLVTAGIENAFPPQYVKDFKFAQKLEDREQARAGMYAALARGQDIEFLSRRFANLTAQLATELDKTGHFLEAKTEWAKAAYPSDSAPPDLRERKRSYITREAESEHLAVANRMKLGVDADLLKEVEDAGAIFSSSEVVFHGARAFDAYLTAGKLAADSKDYERAKTNFDQAEMIANTQWQGGGASHVAEQLAEARWRAGLHELVQSLPLVSKSHLQQNHVPGNLNLNHRNSLEDFVAKKNWSKAEGLFSEAEKRLQENRDGDTIVSEMYSALGKHYDDHEKNRLRRNALWNWGHETNSARAWLALAYWYNTSAEISMGYVRDENNAERSYRHAFEQLQKAVEDLHQALGVNPKLASEPAFIKAVQNNLKIGAELSFPQEDILAELNTGVASMNGDEAQLFLDNFAWNLAHDAQSPEMLAEYVNRANVLANKIGGEAGDEFYARAVAKFAVKPSVDNVDEARYLRGTALIAKKFALLRNP